MGDFSSSLNWHDPHSVFLSSAFAHNTSKMDCCQEQEIRFWGWCGDEVALGNLYDFKFFKEIVACEGSISGVKSHTNRIS